MRFGQCDSKTSVLVRRGHASFLRRLLVAQISDADSAYVRRSDCDTLFIVANYQPDKKDPAVAVNDEHALMRFEFLEAIVRLPVAKYGKVLHCCLGVYTCLLQQRHA